MTIEMQAFCSKCSSVLEMEFRGRGQDCIDVNVKPCCRCVTNEDSPVRLHTNEEADRHWRKAVDHWQHEASVKHDIAKKQTEELIRVQRETRRLRLQLEGANHTIDVMKAALEKAGIE